MCEFWRGCVGEMGPFDGAQDDFSDGVGNCAFWGVGFVVVACRPSSASGWYFFECVAVGSLDEVQDGIWGDLLLERYREGVGIDIPR